MKKLLFLLLILPLVTFSQNIQFSLKTFNNETDSIVNVTKPIEEAQTLRMELHMAAVGTADYDSLVNFKYIFLDIQYNHQILTADPIPHAFPGVVALNDVGPITTRYSFPNTSFSLLQGDLRDSYNKWDAGTATYSESNAKWSVARIAIQLSDKNLQNLLDATTYTTSTPIFTMFFTVKPESSSITEKEFRLTLANVEDTSGTQIANPIYAGGGDTAEGQYQYDVITAVTYNATLHFNLPQTLIPTNFNVTVGTVSGTLGTFTLDSNADVTLPDVTLGQVYSVYNLMPIDASYIPNIHTVTDAYRSFQYLTDVGINGTNTTYNNFGLFIADVNLNGTFNSADTYGLLSYVLGLVVGQEYCLPKQNQDGTWYHGCTATVLYENFTVEKLGAELDIRKTEPTGTNYWNGNFTPTENSLSFDFAFWHHGDLDQSHTTTFPATLAAKAAKSGLNLSTKAVGTTTLDLVSKIEDGLVKVELTHDGLDIVGLQARIKYDTSKLTLKNVIYDTGNTVTNFSKPFEGELLFGGLSTDGKSTIKKGKAFTLEFTPIGTVNNVTGLFYFENTDAVKANGDKINLNIQ